MNEERRIARLEAHTDRIEKRLERIDKRLEATSKIIQAGMKLVQATMKVAAETMGLARENERAINLLIAGELRRDEQIDKLAATVQALATSSQFTNGRKRKDPRGM